MKLKGNIISGSGILCLLLVLWNRAGNYAICDKLITKGSETSCPEGLTAVGITLLPIFPLFLFSLGTYFLRDEVFKVWSKFAIPATVVSMVLIALTSESYASGFGPQMSFGKGDVAFITAALFSLVSIGIIVRQYLRRG